MKAEEDMKEVGWWRVWRLVWELKMCFVDQSAVLALVRLLLVNLATLTCLGYCHIKKLVFPCVICCVFYIIMYCWYMLMTLWAFSDFYCQCFFLLRFFVWMAILCYWTYYLIAKLRSLSLSFVQKWLNICWFHVGSPAMTDCLVVWSCKVCQWCKGVSPVVGGIIVITV